MVGVYLSSLIVTKSMASLSFRARPNSQIRRLPQVFISFRGDDVRKNLVTNLVSEMTSKGVNVFIDTFLQGGLRLENLFSKIKESRIAVVIFSKKYPDSNWCMDELVKEGKLIVIPVFYKVSTRDVKNLHGDFGKSFKKLKAEYEIGQPWRVQKWEASVKSIAGIKGFHGENVSRLVSQITHAVQVWLKEMPAGKVETQTIFDLFMEAFWLSLFVAIFFTVVISPLLFNNAKFFRSVKWIIGFPILSAIWAVRNC